MFFLFFFFNDTATTEIYTLSLHDALPISARDRVRGCRAGGDGGHAAPRRAAARRAVQEGTLGAADARFEALRRRRRRSPCVEGPAEPLRRRGRQHPGPCRLDAPSLGRLQGGLRVGAGPEVHGSPATAAARLEQMKKAVFVAVLFACSSTASAPAQVQSVTVKVAFNKQLNAKIIVAANGMTLYAGRATCGKGCARFWRPLAVNGRPSAGPGAKASLATRKRPDGIVQVTYAGHPLYSFRPDRKPGDVRGAGFQASWYVLSPSG